jgi:hypothetical protein
MFQKAVPVLPAINISNTIEFYNCKLGFTATNFGNYAILRKREVEIHLHMADSTKKFEHCACYLFVDNIEDLYADMSIKDLIYPKGQLVKKPRGFKEFTIKDNNGNVIHFGQKS